MMLLSLMPSDIVGGGVWWYDVVMCSVYVMECSNVYCIHRVLNGAMNRA